MGLLQELDARLKEALKARDEQSLLALRYLKSALQRQAIDQKADLDESQILDVIKKLCKQGTDAKDQFEKAGRAQLAQTEQFRIDLYQQFLGPQLDQSQIEALIDEVIAQQMHSPNGAFHMGKMMAALKQHCGSGQDMGKVAQILKKRLQNS